MYKEVLGLTFFLKRRFLYRMLIFLNIFFYGLYFKAVLFLGRSYESISDGKLLLLTMVLRKDSYSASAE